MFIAQFIDPVIMTFRYKEMTRKKTEWTCLIKSFGLITSHVVDELITEI